MNTLSIGSMSGEHVVYGFLRELLDGKAQGSDTIVLHCESQPPPAELVPDVQATIAVSDRLRHWALRAAWEMTSLRALLRKLDIDRVLNVSGGITPHLGVPQVSLAMNPWCYVPEARSGWMQEFKAFMQRRSYGHAFRAAEHMVYISEHLRDLYRSDNQNRHAQEGPSSIAYVGLEPALFAAADRMKSTTRRPLSILSVSAFAPWKGVEVVVQALRVLWDRGLSAKLSLVGPWPDAAYEQKIRELVTELNLQDAVTIHGKESLEELYRHYASHQVFCLMSRCESFGIPAAEAMAFGTPIVSTDCCAIAEVCNGAGFFGPTGDTQWTARTLEELLLSKPIWDELSKTAQKRAAELTWKRSVSPLLGNISLLGEGRQPAIPLVDGATHT